ncbi:hypothetical protein ACWIGI_41550 [Nocardia sp. NPDC055321]
MYKVIMVPGAGKQRHEDVLEDRMNQMASQGWTLHSVAITSGGTSYLTFVR